MIDYARLSAREAAEIILTAEAPVIVMHQRPDADTVGTAIALARVFEGLGKSATLVCADKIPKRLEFITEGYAVTSKCEAKTVITVDIASPAQAGEIFEAISPVALMIDHHAIGTPFAPNYIRPDASSAAEVLFDIIDELVIMGKIELTREIARALFTAISSDTGSFKYSSATPSTFRLAARLLECGVDGAEIAHRLFSQKSAEEIRAEGYIASRLVTECNGRVAYATHTKKEREALGCTEEHFECAIDIVRELLGVEIALVVRESDKGLIKASLRSTGADVAAIASAFGGGGHVRAAGCTLSFESVDIAVAALMDRIKTLF